MQHSLARLPGILTAGGAALALALGCAGAAHLPARAKSCALSKADSLFSIGNFDGAIAAYQKVRSAMPESPAARTALFAIANANVYYKNPKGNWNAALEAFEQFAGSYPDDNRIGEVRSWVRILTVIRSIDNQLAQATHQVKRLAIDKNTAQESKRYLLDSIAGILQDATQSRDSLVRKNQDLEDIIIDLEKKCQQAGK